MSRHPRHREHRAWDRKAGKWTVGLPDLPEGTETTVRILTLDDLAACYDANRIGWTYAVMEQAARLAANGVPLTTELVAYLERMAIRAAGQSELAFEEGIARRTEQAERKRTESWVYFLRHEGRVKIGVSLNPVARAVSLSRRPADIVAVMQGNERLERSLHARFAADRDGSTEWFTWSPQIAAYVEQHADPFTPQHPAYRKPVAKAKRPARGYDGLLAAITRVES